MLRIACCLAIERGVEVCAPVHDAVLICSELNQIEEDVATMRTAMAEASRLVLAGFELATDVKVDRWPDRYKEGRWSNISRGAVSPRQVSLERGRAAR